MKIKILGFIGERVRMRSVSCNLKHIPLQKKKYVSICFYCKYINKLHYFDKRNKTLRPTYKNYPRYKGKERVLPIKIPSSIKSR